jgi:hypothetical protein
MSSICNSNYFGTCCLARNTPLIFLRGIGLLRVARLSHGGDGNMVGTTMVESPMAKKVGRPKKPSGEGRPVRVDSDIAMMAAKVAAYRGVPLSELLSELLRPLVVREYGKMLRETEPENDGK